MRLGELVGHERPVALLQRSLFENRVSNAYLFAGEADIGKGLAAVAFGRALVCESPDVRPAEGVYEACGHCRACVVSAAGNHPDLRVIEPDGERIKIDQMRGLRHQVSLTGFSSRRRVYILLEAETMTEESANCILKTLEEPPAGVTLILVTESPSLLLPTILSRCQFVRFRPATPAAVETLLVEQYGIHPEQARFIASISGGRVGWAVRAAQHPAVLQVRERLIELLSHLHEAEPVFVFRAAEELRALAMALPVKGEPSPEETETSAPASASTEDRQVRANANAVLDLARTWFRDLLVLKLEAAAPLVNADRHETLLAVAQRTPVERIHRALESLSRTRHYLTRNANVSLALEVLMARLILND